ncbi:MAG: hypothetical protein AAF645_07120 [Myxococcota bacterium]
MSSHGVELPSDYLDLLRELSSAGADYLLIGGWAVAVHGHGRATDDMDVWVRPTRENAERVYSALVAFGAPLPSEGLDSGMFASPRYGYRMGRKPLLIEVLTTIDGVEFEEAALESIQVTIGSLTVPVIGREALLKNKRAAGRPKDLADIEALE